MFVSQLSDNLQISSTAADCGVFLSPAVVLMSTTVTGPVHPVTVTTVDRQLLSATAIYHFIKEVG